MKKRRNFLKKKKKQIEGVEGKIKEKSNNKLSLKKNAFLQMAAGEKKKKKMPCHYITFLCL